MTSLKNWAHAHGIEIAIDILQSDFVLKLGDALDDLGALLPSRSLVPFDIVIANPPYFKLNKSDPRAKAAASIIHGQPNIYSLFMAIGATQLREQGELIFLIPRSFASGPYFQLFRERFFNVIRPELIHVFRSRRDAFVRDAVLQENIILRGVRDVCWSHRKETPSLIISASEGVSDLDLSTRHSAPIQSAINMGSRDKVLRLPISNNEHDLIRLVDSWQGSLGAYGMQVSTGPVVPFRTDGLIDGVGEVPESHVPMLWMSHIKAMRVTWPLGRHKPEYIKHNKAARPLLVPNRNYVLLRRFSAKEDARRLIAGPYLADKIHASMLGLENHLNYIHRPGATLTEEETFGLAALLTSSILDQYFRTSNGNTQVSATELRMMPLPSLETITKIGRQAKVLCDRGEDIDDLVTKVVQDSEQ